MTSGGWGLLLVLMGGCSIDLIEPGSSDAGPGVSGGQNSVGGQGGEGGTQAPSTTSGPGGAPDGPGPGGTGGGPEPPCNTVAVFDGVDDQLTFQPPGTDMTSANELGFSIWLDPHPEAFGTMFVAGRSFESQSQGWMLLLIEDGNEWIVRLRVHQGMNNTCFVDAYVPKASFPLTAHARAYPGGYITMDIDNRIWGEYQCALPSYSTVSSVNAPFRLGFNSFLQQYGAYRGSLDDVYWFTRADRETACGGPEEGEYGWDFQDPIDQAVAAAGLCEGVLLLGTNEADENADPVITCQIP